MSDGKVDGILAYYICRRGHDWHCEWTKGMSPYRDICNQCRDDHELTLDERYRTYRPVCRHPGH